MKQRRKMMALFAVSTVLSPVANAFWFFQNRTAPVSNVTYSHYHRHSYRLHSHRYYHRRLSRTYRRIITEYRVYYVPVPMPTPIHSSRKKQTRFQPHPVPSLQATTTVQSNSTHRTPSVVATSDPKASVSNGVNRKTVAADAAQSSSVKTTPLRTSQKASIANPSATIATNLNAGGNGKPPLSSWPSSQPGQTEHLQTMNVSVPSIPQRASFAPVSVNSGLGNGNVLDNRGYPSSVPFMPIAATVVAAAGIGYAFSRRRRGVKANSTVTRNERLAPDPIEEAGPIAPGSKILSPSSRSQSFNFDEVRRLDVDRFGVAPLFKTPSTVSTMAASEATQNHGDTQVQPASQDTSQYDSAQQSIVQHSRGETIHGVIAELYDTPETKAGLEGFYKHIPAQFHDSTWAKVCYNEGQHYTYAMMTPGMDICLGDEVQLVFGQQDPPVPNQIVAIKRSSAVYTTSARADTSSE